VALSICVFVRYPENVSALSSNSEELSSAYAIPLNQTEQVFENSHPMTMFTENPVIGNEGSGRMRVAVAYSGGVDSTFAARLMLEEGHDVFALNLRVCQTDLIELQNTARSRRREKLRKFHPECTLCTEPCPCTDASVGAKRLGIPLTIIDARDEFRSAIIEPFCSAYLTGQTPNPCAICNPTIKLGLLAQAARARGAQMLVTGHYARIETDSEGNPHLLRSRDREKDQSYFLALCSPEQLRFVRFPLGEWDKERVRREVQKRGILPRLPMESQEICFLHYTRHGDFIASLYPEKVMPGDIVDLSGRRLGRHKGLIYYTIGQRRGLGIASPYPLYVVKLDAERNEVIVGPEEATFTTNLRVEQVNYPSGIPCLNPGDVVNVKIRSRWPERPVIIEAVEGATLLATFTEPAQAVTPGQIAAFYRGDELVAGGVIAEEKAW